MTTTIPKLIHYCWFGGKELPIQTKKYIESWQKFAPDFKIIQWNESNFNIAESSYSKNAYKNGLYAFVADYARLSIVYKYGGVYLDTDVELLKNIDKFLNQEAFFGLEDSNAINTGLIFGAIPKQKNIYDLLNLYCSRGSNMVNGKFDKQTCVKITTDYFKQLGFDSQNKFQIVDGCSIYPSDFFCPQKYGDIKPHITNNTVSYHHYDSSWIADENKNTLLKTYRHARIGRRLKRIIGEKQYENLREIYKRYI